MCAEFSFNTAEISIPTNLAPQAPMIVAAESIMYGLENFLQPERCIAQIQHETDSDFQFERLGIGNIARFGAGALAGHRYAMAINYFGGTELKNKEHRALESNFHNHLMPIAIYPFHSQGKYGEIAYEMEVARKDSSGNTIVHLQEQVRFVRPYVLEDPSTDFHRVITSGSPHFSLIIGHLNGQRNPRPPQSYFVPSSRKTEDFISMILEAREAIRQSKNNFYRERMLSLSTISPPTI